MNDKPNYACPHCGGTEYITPLNSWDRYQAINDRLCWQATELGQCELEIYCRECGERAPSDFESAAQ